MKKETKRLAEGLIHPYPPTQKSRPKWKYVDEKTEAFRLFKTWKSRKHPNFEDDLTEHGKYLLKKYYSMRW